MRAGPRARLAPPGARMSRPHARLVPVRWRCAARSLPLSLVARQLPLEAAARAQLTPGALTVRWTRLQGSATSHLIRRATQAENVRQRRRPRKTRIRCLSENRSRVLQRWIPRQWRHGTRTCTCGAKSTGIPPITLARSTQTHSSRGHRPAICSHRCIRMIATSTIL